MSSEGLEKLFDEWKEFEVDTKHFMEDLKVHFSYPLEEAVLVENFDNLIEEPYHEIHFQVFDNKLRIEMYGFGFDRKRFWEILPKLASTTKVIGKGLGRYGWGMKVGMLISDEVIIETRYGNFHDAQVWGLIQGRPKFKRVEPKENIQENFTIVTHNLNSEYAKKISVEQVKRTLQKYYPTILGGASVLGRKIQVLLNGAKVDPLELQAEKKKPLKAIVKNEEATGYVILAKDEVPEEFRGVAVLVRGRVICREYFGVHGRNDHKITGYLHADFLAEDLAADKTKFKHPSYAFWEIRKLISGQIAEFMKEIGALEEREVPARNLEMVNKQVAEVLAHFPIVNPMALEIETPVIIAKTTGDLLKTLEEGSQLTKRTKKRRGRGKEEPERGREEPVKRGLGEGKAPSEKAGDVGAIRRKRRVKSGPQVRFLRNPGGPEASFIEGKGMAIVNTSHPLFNRARKWGGMALIYHSIRSVFDELLRWALTTGRVELSEYYTLKSEILTKWGEL